MTAVGRAGVGRGEALPLVREAPSRASDGPSPGAGRGAEKGGVKKLPKEESMRFGG